MCVCHGLGRTLEIWNRGFVTGGLGPPPSGLAAWPPVQHGRTDRKLTPPPRNTANFTGLVRPRGPHSLCGGTVLLPFFVAGSFK